MSNEGYKWNHKPIVGIPCGLRYISQRFTGEMEVSTHGFWYYKVADSDSINVICKKVRRRHSSGRLLPSGAPEMFGEWKYKAKRFGDTLARDLSLDDMERFLKGELPAAVEPQAAEYYSLYNMERTYR